MGLLPPPAYAGSFKLGIMKIVKYFKNTQLNKIWTQVPANYYFNLNMFQKVWHNWKWNIIKYLLRKNNLTSKKILDLSCAGGHFTALLFSKYPKATVIGVDIYKNVIREAINRYPEIKFIIADAHKLPFKKDTFDLVVSTETIEHVAKPEKVIQEIYRVLNKNGKLIIEMDSGSKLFKIIWYIWTQYGKGKVWQGSHLHNLNAQKLTRLISNQNFIINQKMFSHLGMAITIIATANK